MAPRKQTPRRALADQLSSRIESLQEGFRKLSTSATPKDLGTRFVEVVHGMMPSMSVDLAHRASGGDWESLHTTSARSLTKLKTLGDQEPSALCTVVKEPRGVCIVQRLVDKTFVGLVASAKKGQARFSELDLVSCRLFVQLFETAYQNLVHRHNEKGLVFSLNHRILQLNSLIETGIEVAKLEQKESPHHLALVRAVSMANASKGVVRVTSGGALQEQYSFPEGVKIERSKMDARRIASRFTFMDRTFTFELFNKESRSGVQPFEETDQMLLDALARQVHASLENRYLHEQALEKQRIEQDLAVAASIQKKILPVTLPAIKGYDLAGVNIPSKSIGGDYYNCIPLPNGTYALVIADVAGKGIQAALLVSSLHAYLCAYLEGSFSLTELAERLNKVLYQDSTDDKFITAFIAILTPETGDIECVSAGHNPPCILRNDGRVEVLNVGGLPLAIMDVGIAYESSRVKLEQGERLLFHTDGVTEAQNERHQLFEHVTPLPEYLARHKTDRAETFISNLIADLRTFSGSAPQSDDITIIYLHRL